MNWLRTFASRLHGFFSKQRIERDLDSEVQSHLDMLIAENIRHGMTPAAARHAAKREFGGVEQTKEECREQRGLPLLDGWFEDVRFAIRMLGKRPGLTFVAVLTLAIGMGANTAIFTAVHSVLLQSLPFPKADRLAIVWSTPATGGGLLQRGPGLEPLGKRTAWLRDRAAIWRQTGGLTGKV